MPIAQEVCSGRWAEPVEIYFVSKQSCRFFARRIVSHRHQSIVRQSDAGFYTLVTSSY